MPIDTASAITAESKPGIDPSQAVVYILPVVQTNPGSATLAVDGGDPLPLLDPAGAALAPGALVAGRITMVVPNGDEYRLLSPALAVATFDHKGTYAALTAYDEGQVVTGSDGNWYQLKVPTATGDDPVSGGSGNWLRILTGAAVSDRSLAEVKLTKRLSARTGALFDAVADLLADTTLSYTDVDPGDIVTVGDVSYKVAASSASDAHEETAGGVKLYVVEDVVRPDMFGATAGAATSQSSYFQKMFDAGVVDIYLPAGVWRCDTTVTCDHDIRLTGPGTLDFSNGNAQLLIAGSLAPLSAMSANVAKHSQTLQWSSSQGLAARDIVMGYNPTDFSFGSRRAEYRDGFMFRIHSMSGNNARVYGLAVDAYAAADFDMYKMVAPRVIIDGPSFVAGTGSLAAVTCRNCQDVVIRDVKSWGGQGQLVEVDQCFGADIDATKPMNNSAFVNDEYGIVIANSHHVSVRGGNPAATRHPISIGGYGKVGSIPNRYINISGVSLQNNGLGTGVAAMDIHGCSDFVTYENCISIGGGFGGRNIAYRNCTIFGQVGSTSGEALYGAEVVGGFFSIEDCTIISNGDGGAIAYVNLAPLGPGNGTNRPVETHMREDVEFVVRNLTLITPNAGAIAKAIAVRGQNADKKTNVTIDGVRWVAPQGYAFFVADDSVLATFPSDGIIVDNVNGPAGAYLIAPTTHVSSVPTREMTQTVAEVVACTSGQSSAVGAGVNFRYPYSRVPELIGAGFRSTNGAAKQTWGNQFLTAWAYSVTATTARMAAGSVGAAFDSTEDARISGTFGLRGI